MARNHQQPAPEWRLLATLFVAGLLVAWLGTVMVGTLSSGGQPKEDTAPSPTASPPTAHSSRAPGRRTSPGRPTRPADRSTDELLAELRRLLAGPENALTTLRLQALMDAIPTARIPELIALGNQELDDRERAALYEPLLERWAGENPLAALDFALDERVGSQVDSTNGTNLLNNLFETWARKDLPAARSWLLDRWDHDTLGEDAFLGTLRQFLAIDVLDELLSRESPSAALAFAADIPGDSDRHKVLAGILGASPWHSTTMASIPPNQRLSFYHTLRESLAPSQQGELLAMLWRKWGEDASTWVREVEPELEPSDRFHLALGELGVRARWGELKPLGDGSFTRENLGVPDREVRIEAAFEAGQAAGYSRTEVLQAMSEVFLEILPGESLQWFRDHHEEFDSDPILAREAREHVVASSWSGDNLPPMVAIQWASLISDQALRSQLSRGAYLRLVQRDPAAARAYLDRPDTPPDLIPEFEALLPTDQ